MRVIHNNDLTNFDIPKYSVQVLLPEINMRYEKSQFHDTVRLFEYLTDYNKFLLKIENKRKFKIFSPITRNPKSLWKFAGECIIKTIRQRKNRTINLFRPSSQILDFNKENFKKIYRKLKETDQKVIESNDKLFDKIIYVSRIDDLYEWVTEVLTEIESETTKRDQEKKPSRWKFWQRSRKAEDEAKEVEPAKDSIPKSYVWLKFRLNFLKGSLELSKIKEIAFESLLFSFENCVFETKMRLQGGSLSLVLENLSLQSVTDAETVPIFEKLQPNSEPLLDLSVDMNPIELSVAYSLIFSTQPIVVDYTPEAYLLINSFFIVPEAQESAKTAAWDTLQGLQDTTRDTLTDLLYGDTKYLVHVKARGPQVRIPAQSQGKFLLDLGIVEVKNSENPDSSEYECLNFSISGIELLYENLNVQESVINRFSVYWGLYVLKTKFKNLKWSSISGSLDSFPDFVLKGELSEFILVISPSTYHKLKSISENFNVKRKSLSNNITDIVKKSVMSSHLKRKSKNIQQWHAYFAVLSGGYIYFFLNEDQKMPLNYYYIKDCSLEDIHDLGLSCCIRLRNRYGECILSFNSEIELHFWKRSLNEQIQEFESYKSVAKDIVDDNRTANKQRVSLEFQISTLNIILCNEDKENLAEFIVKRIGMNAMINPYDSIAHFYLKSLQIRDMVRVNRQHFTTLAQSVSEGKDLIDIEFRLYSPKSPNYSDKDIQLKVKMADLEINWNPDFISTILNFFEFADYSDPNRNSQKKMMVKPEHILFDLEVCIDSISLYLNNIKRGLSIGLISILQLRTVMLIKDGGNESQGTLGDFEIYDLTNYPKSAISTGTKLKLFSKRKNTPVMLEFKITTFHESNPKKKQNITSDLEIKMNSVKLYYFNQPVLRIIDYLMYKVLGVLDSVSRVRNIYTFSSVYRLSTLLGSSVVQAIKTENLLQKFGFASVKISISNPLLKFYPRPQLDECFVMDLGDIFVTNLQEIDESRGNEPVWIDMYTVNMRNINIKSPEQTVASEFDLLMHIHRPVLTALQSLDPELDKSYTILTHCERLRLTFSQSDFTLLLKLFDLNLTYDDQLEEYINPKTKDPNLDPEGKFLYFYMKTKVMSILFTHEEEELVEIFCANQELKMWKYNNYSSVMNFTSGHWLGLIPEEAVNSENPEHAEIAEAIFSISMDNIRNFEDFEDDDMRLSYVLFGPIGNLNPLKPVITIDVNTLADGSKSMIVDITQLRLNFHLAAILQLQNFIYYGFPDYSSLADTPYDYMEKYRPKAGMIKKEVKTQYLAPELEVKLSIQEPIVLLPSIIHQRVLVVQSDFSYTFFRDPESMYLLEQTPNTVKSFEAMHLEIYTCKLTELTKHSFTDIVKRKILEPVELIYKSVQVKVTPRISSYTVDYLMGNLLFTLSHKDLMLIGNVFSFQKEMLEREAALINVLKKTFVQKEDFLPRMSVDERNLMLRLSRDVHRRNTLEFEATDEHDYSPSMRSMTIQPEKPVIENTSLTSFSIAGLTLLLIYDTSITYSPVVDINAADFRLTIEEAGSDFMYKTGAVVRSNFYNPILDTWEPFIENVAFQIESIFSPESNPMHQGILIIEKGTILNINLSEVMISHFLALTKGWRVKEDSLIREVVSPISIKNFCGSDLLIEKNSLDTRNGSEVIKLKDGENKFFEVESMEMKTINLSQEFLNVSVLSERKKYSSCENIPINKVQSLTHIIKTAQEEIPIIFDIELVETSKVFTVRSSIVLVNETAHDLKILFSRKSMSDEKYCKSHESIPVPIQYVKHLMGVMPMSMNAPEWSMVRLDELKKQGQEEEIRVGDFYLSISVKIDSKNKHKTSLYLRPPIVFRNQIPKTITLQIFYEESLNSKEITILTNGLYYEHSHSGCVDVSFVMNIENFQPSKQILLLSQREKSPKALKLYDYRYDLLQVQIEHSHEGSHTFTFYCYYTIINSTGLSLNFYYRKSGMTETIAGQNYLDSVVPCGPTRKLAIGIGKEKSEWMHVGTVGTEDSIEFVGEEFENVKKRYQFSYSVSLAKALDSELVFSKVVLISPRYILINNMPEDILIRQYHAQAGEFLLEKENRSPFHWPDCEKPEMIRVKVAGQWSWSGQFSLANIGTFTIQNRHRAMMNHYILINVEVKIVDRSFYIIFEQENEEFCSYRIENHSNKVCLKAYQKGCREEIRYLDVDSLISFAWSRPQKENLIVIEFCVESFDENLPISETFSFNKINQNFTICLKNNLKIYAKIECEGPTKILKFSDSSLLTRKYEDDRIKTQYSISVPALGLSIIEHYKEAPKELLYLSANGITFFAQENSKQWVAELIIAYMQLDNQVSVPAIYPVIMSPGKLDEKNVLHISVFYSFTNNPSIYCFENCEFLMQELAIKIESKILQKTVEMATRLFFNSSAVIMLSDVYKNYQKPRWMSEEKIKLNKRYYFAKIALSPIKLILSLIPIKEEDDESDIYGKVSKALGMAITTIDLAPVKLNSLEMSDVFGSQWQILSAFKVHYGKQLIAELLSLIGHAEILGNPIGLLNNLGTGVKDFFYEPAQGMIHGPLSAGKGFLKGTGSLLKNTVEGTFDTFSKLTNSTATAITSLTQDREYLRSRQREQAMNKPRNIVDGVEMGVKSFLTNLGQGFSGVVSEPVKGYKKNKFTGMLIGSMRGLSGLVVKPMAGVLDVASKAAEGIKNTAGSNNYFGKSERKRPPRVFYGKNLVMKPYQFDDCLYYNMIAEIKKGKYQKEKFVGFIEGYDSHGKHWVVYFFIEKIILFNMKKKKAKWEIDIATIKSCELQTSGLTLKTSPILDKKGRENTAFLFPFSDLRISHQLLQKISELLPTT